MIDERLEPDGDLVDLGANSREDLAQRVASLPHSRLKLAEVLDVRVASWRRSSLGWLCHGAPGLARRRGLVNGLPGDGPNSMVATMEEMRSSHGSCGTVYGSRATARRLNPPGVLVTSQVPRGRDDEIRR